MQYIYVDFVERLLTLSVTSEACDYFVKIIYVLTSESNSSIYKQGLNNTYPTRAKVEMLH